MRSASIFRRFATGGAARRPMCSASGMKTSPALVDSRVVRCHAGSGGAGSVSYFKHIKQFLLGPGNPSGGRGGNGGSVLCQMGEQNFSLKNVRGKVRADNGNLGGKKSQRGRDGRDAVIDVPPGTCVSIVLDIGRDEKRKLKVLNKRPLIDLSGEGARSIIVAQGGKGGSGNNRSTPHEALVGEPGEATTILLELKSLADVGLVGAPNAGKSTLLGAISRACPKIAPYPFTTIAPHLGRVQYSDGQCIVVADLPGLIEGSHLNRGMGHEFLRHVERTKVLAFVLDMTSEPLIVFTRLRSEVAKYSAELAAKPFLVVGNKCDLTPEESLRSVDELWEQVRHKDPCPPVVAISGKFGDGIPNLIRELRTLVSKAEELQALKLDEEMLGHAGA